MRTKGTSFLEIYQNCNIFNDGAFFSFTEKSSKPDTAIFLEQGQPLIFGTESNKGVRLDGYKPQLVDLGKDGFSKDDLWVHDESDIFKAQILTRFFDDPANVEEAYFPRPFGVIYQVDRLCYEDQLLEQVEEAKQKAGEQSLQDLLMGRVNWEVK